MFARTVKKVITTTRGLATLSIESSTGALKFDTTAATKVLPKSNEVTVSMKMAPITFEDVLKIRGHSLIGGNSGVAGSTGVGSVVEAGSEASVKTNDLVLVTDRCWSDTITVSKNNVLKLGNLSAEVAASVPAFVAAQGMLQQLTGLKAGDTIVQTLGDSAIGQAISQLAKLHNVNVTNISIEDLTNVNKMREIKVNHAINGIPATGKTLHMLFKIVKNNGTIVHYRGTKGVADASIAIPVSSLIFNDIAVNGFDYSTWAANDKIGFGNAVNLVSQLLEEKKISLVANTLPLSDYKKATDSVEQTGSHTVFKF